MKKEFTPGPWNKDTGAGAYTVIEDKNGTRIAHVFSRTIPLEQTANARLIAQAPALLDACAKLLEWIDNLEKQGYQDELINAMPNNFGRQVARKIIAQATGNKE